MTTAADIIDYMTSLHDEAQRRILLRFFKTGPGEYGEGDDFIGIRVPDVRRLVRVTPDFPLDEVPALLASRWHEVRLYALLTLAARFGRLARPRLSGDADAIGRRDAIVQMYLQHAERANNWDLVDTTAPHVLGLWLLMPTGMGGHVGMAHDYKQTVLDALATSDNLWRQRMSVVCTWMTTREGDPTWAMRQAERMLHHPHDLMHKAVGWMLREVGKRCDRELLRDFLERHAASMPRTALRYSIEQLPDDERRFWMSRREAHRERQST